MKNRISISFLFSYSRFDGSYKVDDVRLRSPLKFPSENGLSLGSKQSSIRMRNHDMQSVSKREHDCKANDAHHRVSTGITAPGLLEGLLSVSTTSGASETPPQRRAINKKYKVNNRKAENRLAS